MEEVGVEENLEEVDLVVVFEAVVHLVEANEVEVMMEVVLVEKAVEVEEEKEAKADKSSPLTLH
tara:strand:+ start:196 stop:387 length:192 start_codon:yes stop_codon:yes gene_type:complete